MSSVAADLFEIRGILKEELNLQIGPLHGEIEALRNDMKDTYGMITDLEKAIGVNKAFKNMSSFFLLITYGTIYVKAR